ncbi:helix-turn-helix transcriptional regulator [Devosia neptuniae]|jgi:predicted transcriptional regulator/transcriptional regulator with XRE-family HTH domain|uniref:helix-turn-helix domain-containing protein n=1 Tax=Devosia TaxID=46913 RepID=UPI0022AF2797|nr:helix-turn-helix transcriptional regulator [Devosia neptuniae]MCZ4344750.1 short-chain fatty acyl-CoA regulator family protein [Devosia neptuniae]|tara:strand:+ start:464 stop:1876 length:1413 start_codon:yes stop_codon:yes gene_type:complete
MATRKIFAGARLRALRTQHKLTQGELAARLDISASYVNQIESNQRPLTASVMMALADGFNLDLSELMTDTSDRLLADLREALADPVFGEGVPNLQELKTVAANAPDMARAMLALYETYRKTNERLASVDAALTRDPHSGMQTAYEEVRDFFHYADNYIDPLDRAAEALADELGTFEPDRLNRLMAYCGEAHDLRVVLTAPTRPDLIKDYDRSTRTLAINARLEPATQFFQIAAHLAVMEQTTLLEQLLDAANFKTTEARAIARMGLTNYFAGALQMPYGAFLKAAEAHRYDIEELGHLFGASLEQVAHRLSTMQRPREKGVPFFFARVDAAGTITKRHSATALQFARFGGACPLWNVHRAFEAHGQIIRQLAETPDGNRYLCLAWSSEKRSGGYHGVTRRYAYALGCEISHANRLVYGSDIEPARASFDPIGVSCRICERRNCPQRSVPPLAAEITIDSNRRAIVPYQIS